MTYQIARDGQEFGPYSLSDVQRYVATGNILLTDLARAEGSTEWLPVTQIIGTIAVPQQVAPTGYAPAAMPQYEDAPNLHWGLVLLFSVFTCGLFMVVWDLIQVLWLRKIGAAAKAFPYFLIFLGVYIGNILVAFVKGSLIAAHASNPSVNRTLAIVQIVSGILTIASIIMMIVYRFTMRTALEEHFTTAEPIGLTLSGVMTFFFGSLYFQYHLNRINAIKRAYRLANPY